MTEDSAAPGARRTAAPDPELDPTLADTARVARVIAEVEAEKLAAEAGTYTSAGNNSAGAHTAAGAHTPAEPARAEPDEEELPNFTEQLSTQLGGVRGLIESSIPVVVFVVLNVWPWPHLSLRTAIIGAVGTAVAIAAYRLARKQPVRHAANGVFGVALGAFLAWRSGNAKDFYAPGILINLGYGVGLIASAVFRLPVVGWVWSVVAAGGRSDWRSNPRLMRAFEWLTLLWAAMFMIRGVVQGALYLADETTWLGISRIALNYPLYAVVVGITLWAVRRATHHNLPELPEAT